MGRRGPSPTTPFVDAIVRPRCADVHYEPMVKIAGRDAEMGSSADLFALVRRLHPPRPGRHQSRPGFISHTLASATGASSSVTRRASDKRNTVTSVAPIRRAPVTWTPAIATLQEVPNSRALH